ncbi:uncharacterized protein LOC127284631 isoform X2 [Leptopilina boulardi]|nr:uncharacterized protein LOC127284631 isoform X2 [Leptopilina boulardi]XP_051166128.1 uncharacterized protein LOC127284631 isoform X2 [Leptopilina boulardi]
MLCIRNFGKNCISRPVRLILKANYSRRSKENTSTFEIIKSNNGESVDDFDNTIFGANPNWELLTPRGFRFYLPGSIGPGWLDASTIAQVETHSEILPADDSFLNEMTSNSKKNTKTKRRRKSDHPILHFVAQQCPILLRKEIAELFPGCPEVHSPQLTIISLSQKIYVKTARWSKEEEAEKVAKYFVLAASDICMKLKMIGFWSDFINPFSGQPYNNILKISPFYKSNPSKRCLDFKIDQKDNCKIISYDKKANNFIGNLYTTAPSTFLKEIIYEKNVQ